MPCRPEVDYGHCPENGVHTNEVSTSRIELVKYLSGFPFYYLHLLWGEILPPASGSGSATDRIRPFSVLGDVLQVVLLAY